MEAEKAIIAIGREYGSGGHDIGKLVADKLGVPFYDKEILTLAARESGICEALFENHDEKNTPSYLFPLVTGMGDLPSAAGAGDIPLNHRIFMAQFEAITRVSLKGPCVIVGRCANYVLKGQPNLISVFLYGDVSARIERIMQKENLPYDQAKERVRKVDKQRQGYYNFFADGNWGHRSNYHMMLNTTGLALDAAADTIIQYIRAKTIK
ncbi:MAG TPA: cytidylate kinase-like family protein [Candidatus Limiplasma sp.]|nr:cytidylate kinase-like family protein [Candidatus Limiplasma sp.]HPS81695.1 cytidylate kinase-like family protein [Candidatus Limiplasma sp.]